MIGLCRRNCKQKCTTPQTKNKNKGNSIDQVEEVSAFAESSYIYLENGKPSF